MKKKLIKKMSVKLVDMKNKVSEAICPVCIDKENNTYNVYLSDDNMILYLECRSCGSSFYIDVKQRLTK